MPTAAETQTIWCARVKKAPRSYSAAPSFQGPGDVAEPQLLSLQVHRVYTWMTGTSLLKTQENLVGTIAFDFMTRSCTAHRISHLTTCPRLNFTAVLMQYPSTDAVNRVRVNSAFISTWISLRIASYNQQSNVPQHFGYVQRQLWLPGGL